MIRRDPGHVPFTPDRREDYGEIEGEMSANHRPSEGQLGTDRMGRVQEVSSAISRKHQSVLGALLRAN